MTWSARIRSVCGIVSPSALAVLRLIISSNFVGRSMGMSPGLVPLRVASSVALLGSRSLHADALVGAPASEPAAWSLLAAAINPSDAAAFGNSRRGMMYPDPP